MIEGDLFDNESEVLIYVTEDYPGSEWGGRPVIGGRKSTTEGNGDQGANSSSGSGVGMGIGIGVGIFVVVVVVIVVVIVLVARRRRASSEGQT